MDFDNNMIQGVGDMDFDNNMTQGVDCMDLKSVQDMEDAVKSRFAKNLKNFLKKNGYTQKYLSAKLNCTESIVSDYIKTKKLPSTSFLIKFNAEFPEISIDTLLNGVISNEKPIQEEKTEVSFAVDFSKYCAVYFLYYIDSGKNKMIRSAVQYDESGAGLKTGVLCIYEKTEKSNPEEACCLAVFGIETRSEAQEVKALLEQYPSPEDFISEGPKKYRRRLYQGTFRASKDHLFIELQQAHERKDDALILLHYPSFDRYQYQNHYIGGLGTLNSASSGREPDPVVQRIALSRNEVFLSDEEIRDWLKFRNPRIEESGETEEILRLVKTLYENSAKNTERKDSSFNSDLKQYIPGIIRSKIEDILNTTVENNIISIGRVTKMEDDDWCHVLRKSAEYHEGGGDRDESDTAADYRIL